MTIYAITGYFLTFDFKIYSFFQEKISVFVFLCHKRQNENYGLYLDFII